MILYVSVFLQLVLMRYALFGQEALRHVFYPALMAALFVFVAFRYEVGCDWAPYLNHYEIAGSPAALYFHILERREPLWWAIVEAIHWLELTYPWLNVASAAIFFGGVHVLARRQPDPFGFVVLLFPILIVNMPMSGIRQGAAIGLICIALAAFSDRRPVRFVALTVIASMIHSSAVVFLLLTPLTWGRYTSRRVALAGLLAVPVTVVLAGSGSADLAVLRYLESERDAAGALFRVALLSGTGLLFLVLLRRRWRQLCPEDYLLVSVGSAMMLFLIALLPVSTIVADRFGYYLIPMQAIILARLPYLRLGAAHTFYSAAPYVVLLLVFIVWSSQSWHFGQCYVPYRSWLFGIPLAPAPLS